MTKDFPISDDPASPRDDLNTVPTYAVSWTRRNGLLAGNSRSTPSEAQALANRVHDRGCTDITIRRQHIAGHVF